MFKASDKVLKGIEYSDVRQVRVVLDRLDPTVLRKYLFKNEELGVSSQGKGLVEISVVVSTCRCRYLSVSKQLFVQLRFVFIVEFSFCLQISCDSYAELGSYCSFVSA